MTEQIPRPFSARNRGAFAQIDNDCPETTRIGLLHIIRRLTELEYVGEWKNVSDELRRIARILPSDKTQDIELLLLGLPWDKVFDFCERLYGHLAQPVWRYNQQTEESEIQTERTVVQEYIRTELGQLFLEENLAFEFSDGVVRRRGRRHTVEQVNRAEVVLGDPRLPKARGHFNKALKYFRNVAQPDYENAVKEAVCAVEATARVCFPDGGTTLGEIVKSMAGSESGQLPKAIANTFYGLYGFRNSGEGVGHGGAEGGPVTKDLAEYALAVSASQIVLLVNLAASLDQDIPF